MVNGIIAAARTHLNPLRRYRDTEIENAPGAYKARGRDHVLGPDMVEGAEAICIAPTSPIAQLPSKFPEIRHAANQCIQGRWDS